MNIDTFYPVGSIYMCTDSAFNPNEYSPFEGSIWSSLNDSAANISTTGTTSGYVGANSVSLTTAMMQSHNHTGSLVVAKVGAGGSWGTFNANGTLQKKIPNGGSNHPEYYGAGTFTASTIGGGGTHENRMRSLQVCRWIRTA